MKQEDMLKYYIKKANELKDVIGVRDRNVFGYIIEKHQEDSNKTKEGLPGIGSVCEVFHKDDWVLGRCIARENPKWAGPFAVILIDGYQGEVVKAYAKNIRDVEKEDNKTILEVEGVVKRVINSDIIWPPCEKKIAYELWRLGYRKNTETSE